jgi:hypothetical protein
MRTLAPIVALLVCAGLAGQTAIPFRLIGTRHSAPSDAIREFEYNVSVEQNLDVSSIRNTVCQVLRSEKPSAYEILAVTIYYNLERYIPEEGMDAKLAAELRERRIAQYHWNKDSPKDKRRLAVTKDAKGQSLKEWKFYDFDHMKACR